jgi:hypothetical protein
MILGKNLVAQFLIDGMQFRRSWDFRDDISFFD